MKFDDQLLKMVATLAPSLTGTLHKGQCGRVGVVGGSFEYSGAPYYAGISALKTGADLCHVLCSPEAVIPIKCYSPELIVHGVLTTNSCDTAAALTSICARLDSVVIGPGLGRDASILEGVALLLKDLKKRNFPVVIDGDALYLIAQQPSLIQHYSNAILTPNIVEFARLCVTGGFINELDLEKARKISPNDLCRWLDVGVVLQKGKTDIITDGVGAIENPNLGSPRRCGGQGDILGGIIGTFLAWNRRKDIQEIIHPTYSNLMLCALGGSLLTRSSAAKAFDEHLRATTTPDVIYYLGRSFQELFPMIQDKL